MTATSQTTSKKTVPNQKVRPKPNRAWRKQRDKKSSGEMRPLTRPAIERRILVYDFETKDSESQDKGFDRAFLVAFYDGDNNEFYSFRNKHRTNVRHLHHSRRAVVDGGCIDRFMRFVLAPENRGKYTADVADIYAHNGGKFDVDFILVWLREHIRDWSVEIVSVAGSAQRVMCWPRNEDKDEDGKNCYSFTDSILIISMSLAKAAKTFTPEDAGKMSFDLDLHEDDPRWDEYNKVDCEVLYRCLKRFKELMQALGGEVGMTAPSTAMKLYRRAFQDTVFKISAHFPGCKRRCRGDDGLGGKCTRAEANQCDGDCHGCLHRWIRRGYYGGRTEIFNRYAPPGLYEYDINSSYPASMLEYMPVGEPICVEGSHEFYRTIKQYSKKYIGFVEAEVFIPDDCVIPPLPFVHEKKLKFPTGTFSGVFSWVELETIFDPFVRGKILNVKRAVWYKKEKVFEPFIRRLYEYRSAENRKKDPAMSELAKLLMNSLYGKFGMNEEREEVILTDPNIWRPAKGRPITGKDDSSTWVCKKYVSASYIIPQIASHVTALSRRRLWEALRDVTLAGGVVYYCDTDSCKCNIPFPEHLVDPGVLGKWKEEGSPKEAILCGEYVLPKMYTQVPWVVLLPKKVCVPLDIQCQKVQAQLVSSQEAVECPSLRFSSCAPAFGIASPIYKNCKTYVGVKSTIKIKGVPKRAQTAENFRALLDGKQVRFKRILMHRTILRMGLDAPVEKEFHKATRTSYDKRQVFDDGRTKPIHLDEIFS